MNHRKRPFDDILMLYPQRSATPHNAIMIAADVPGFSPVDQNNAAQKLFSAICHHLNTVEHQCTTSYRYL